MAQKNDWTKSSLSANEGVLDIKILGFIEEEMFCNTPNDDDVIRPRLTSYDLIKKENASFNISEYFKQEIKNNY